MIAVAPLDDLRSPEGDPNRAVLAASILMLPAASLAGEGNAAVLAPLLLRSCDRRVLTPQRAQMSFVDKVTARDVRRAAYLEGGLLRGVWYLSLGGAEEKSGILMSRYLNGRN